MVPHQNPADLEEPLEEKKHIICIHLNKMYYMNKIFLTHK